jgi:Arc/MetJ-type ribon-helix-helix transcriptional regulator
MNTRIGIRISPAERAKIENAIRNGSAQNLSDYIRKALEAQLQHSTPKVLSAWIPKISSKEVDARKLCTYYVNA